MVVIVVDEEEGWDERVRKGIDVDASIVMTGSNSYFSQDGLGQIRLGINLPEDLCLYATGDVLHISLHTIHDGKCTRCGKEEVVKKG